MSITLHSTAAAAPHLASIASADEFSKLLGHFSDVTTPSFSSLSLMHGVELFISVNGQPLHALTRRLPPDKL